MVLHSTSAYNMLNVTNTSCLWLRKMYIALLHSWSRFHSVLLCDILIWWLYSVFVLPSAQWVLVQVHLQVQLVPQAQDLPVIRTSEQQFHSKLFLLKDTDHKHKAKKISNLFIYIYLFIHRIQNNLENYVLW